MEKQLVMFTLGSEYFAVDIASVEGIIKMQSITVVPHAPSFVEGVTNLRGNVLPVIDLRKRFGLVLQDITKDARIIVVFLGGVKVGMIVDSVSEVLRIPEESIAPPPPMVTTVDLAFIHGIAKLNDRLIILLDLNKVLSTQEKQDLSATKLVQ